uniref:Uncharacterized protein n=1 Tax=Triticum urartu TaxID=4572 RepID=A0A8R7UES9_TRIUA
MVHSMVTAELSVPPAMMSWTKALTPSRVSLASVPRCSGLAVASSGSHRHLAPLLVVLIENPLEEPIVHLAQPLHPPDAALHVEPPEPWHPLADVAHRSGHRERFIKRSPELLTLRAAVAARPLLPDRHAQDIPQRGVRQVLPDRNGTAAAFEQATHERPELLLPNILVRVDAARGEELGGAEPARHTPVCAIRGVHDTKVPVRGVLAGSGARTVGEGEVVCLEDEPGGIGGGGDDGVVGTKTEVHERAVARRERSQSAVRRERAREGAEAAEHWPAPRSRREVQGLTLAAP